MGEYAERPNVPEPTPAPPSGDQLVRDLSSPLFEAKGWMKFLGVLMIIGGVLQALTVVGIIICWLPIWLGVLLFQAASGSEGAHQMGNKSEFYKSLSKLKTYFTIQGILVLIMIILSIVMMFVVGTAGLLGALSELGGGY
jgi:hypothetical protein